MGRRGVLRHSPSRVAWALGLLALFCFASLAQQQADRSRQRTGAQRKETRDPFKRPPVSRPIKPTVPQSDRRVTDKVFLENADSLFRPMNSLEEKQIVKGQVKFRQAGMWMFCDSAYYFPEKNSLDAFGHVRMEQGDTLFVFADRLYYDGDSRHARLRCGPSQRDVILRNRNVTLTTDSFDYNLIDERGWYDCGGKLQDEVNTLTSMIGEYFPSTKDARFFRDVELVNSKDGFKLLSDTLYYNTGTHIAKIVSRTEIQGRNDTILTSGGTYNTATDKAELTTRSTILHRDSNNNVTTLEGDSIIYDRATRRSYAYKFKNNRGQPMVLTDTARKSILIGGFGLYNDSTREALATDYPLLVEFSRPDTLFLRADTILTFVKKGLAPVTKPSLPMDSPAAAATAGPTGSTDAVDSAATSSDSVQAASTTKPLPADSIMKEYHVAKAFRRARFFNKEVQGVADSIEFVELDSMLYMFRKPVVWSGERQVAGNRIDVHLNDSTADWALLPSYGMMVEHVEEDFYNQLAGKRLLAFFEGQDLKRLEVEGNVETIFLPQEKDSTYSRLVKAESSYLTIDMDGRDLSRLKMWPEVNGTVTPLFLVKKKEDKELMRFKWLGNIRPRREWMGGVLRWADDLGEIPDEMERYFREPPIFPDEAPAPSMPGGADDMM